MNAEHAAAVRLACRYVEDYRLISLAFALCAGNDVKLGELGSLS